MHKLSIRRRNRVELSSQFPTGRRRLLNICCDDWQAARVPQSRASRRDSIHRITLSRGERVPALCWRVRGYLWQ